jgi:hypothetical protein
LWEFLYSSWLGRLLPFTTTLLAPMPNISFEADGFAAAQFQR